MRTLKYGMAWMPILLAVPLAVAQSPEERTRQAL
jgi:hypothetical protein